MVTLPAGVSPETGMPFGLALMGTAWSESTLIRYVRATEDLQISSRTDIVGRFRFGMVIGAKMLLLIMSIVTTTRHSINPFTNPNAG